MLRLHNDPSLPLGLHSMPFLSSGVFKICLFLFLIVESEPFVPRMWYCINYKLMKKKVKQCVQGIKQGGKEHRCVLKEFARMLDDQIEKTVLFFLERQGIIAHKIQELGEERTMLLDLPYISKISELQEAYIAVGYDLLNLLKFVDVNATASRTPRKLSIDQPSTALVVQDPVIYLLHASVDKLTHSTNFLQFLGQHALIIEEEEEQVNEERYHSVSLTLNLANTFLYMVNTCIVVPTADDYSMSLGAAATVCGIIIGSMAAAQVFSSVYFSAWSYKSYFKPLMLSSIVLFLGNPLYALAYDLSSLTILLIGRLLCGMRSVELLIYFMLKYAMEILLAESSITTSFYFGWSRWTMSSVAIFLAVLGLTVLPVNAVVGTYISNMFEARQILVLLGLLLSFDFTSMYTIPQYVSSALITFVAKFLKILVGVPRGVLTHHLVSGWSPSLGSRLAPAVVFSEIENLRFLARVGHLAMEALVENGFGNLYALCPAPSDRGHREKRKMGDPSDQTAHSARSWEQAI
ncbi:hypothetical protein ZIOFF_040355 [Zingiber officinale]|uniref:SPX domain-containing protein n=1 Tax=Zingiber officinale TaxID=94328 RepID=A0A8J5GCH8_ZINOF|nr:hypothetical protein ZIOFF_040355 [Zingiber officinale]